MGGEGSGVGAVSIAGASPEGATNEPKDRRRRGLDDRGRARLAPQRGADSRGWWIECFVRASYRHQARFNHQLTVGRAARVGPGVGALSIIA